MRKALGKGVGRLSSLCNKDGLNKKPSRPKMSRSRPAWQLAWYPVPRTHIRTLGHSLSDPRLAQRPNIWTEYKAKLKSQEHKIPGQAIQAIQAIANGLCLNGGKGYMLQGVRRGTLGQVSYYPSAMYDSRGGRLHLG